jgi:hypothetical protein
MSLTDDETSSHTIRPEDERHLCDAITLAHAARSEGNPRGTSNA